MILRSIQVTYGTLGAPQHGGNGGAEVSFTLADGEYITRVFGGWGNTWKELVL